MPIFPVKTPKVEDPWLPEDMVRTADLKVYAKTADVMAKASAIPGYDAAKAQTLQHDASGVLAWVDNAPVVTTETWVFNDTPAVITAKTFSDIAFTSNDTAYTEIYINSEAWSLNYRKADSTANRAYKQNNGWDDNAYKTIVLSEPATGELLTYLEANATKQ